MIISLTYKFGLDIKSELIVCLTDIDSPKRKNRSVLRHESQKKAVHSFLSTSIVLSH